MEDMGQIMQWIQILLNTLHVIDTLHSHSHFVKVNVVTYDYTGYGIHNGEPSGT